MRMFWPLKPAAQAAGAPICWRWVGVPAGADALLMATTRGICTLKFSKTAATKGNCDTARACTGVMGR
ncbi:hypothetical protein DERA104750_14505 [Deinococcus radiodurans]